MNEKIMRLSVFIAAVILHLVILLFFVFDTERLISEEGENARVMKLTDINELPPPPSDPEIPDVEEIAEMMIETDTPPLQNIVGAGTLHVQENYLLMHQVSNPPEFDISMIMADLVYPPIALRSGIEGRVILELFVDRTGTVQRVIILREEPEGRGFGEAAARALTGRKGKPAAANGEPVSCRYRYPIRFTIK